MVDDTQALGVLGSPVVDTTATRALPFGSKGTGTLAFLGVPTDAAVVVGSLGKAFGIPMAFAAGPEKWIRHTRASGPLLRASSQVPLGLVRAARYALTWNSNLGDTARRQLTRAVEQFSSLPRIQGAPHSPVQRLVLPRLRQAHALWQELLDRGIWSLLERDGRTGGALTFLLTAAHEGPAIARCRAKLESLQGGCVW